MNYEVYNLIMNNATADEKNALTMMMQNANDSEKHAFMCMLTRTSNDVQNEIVSRMFKNTNIFNRNKHYIMTLVNDVLDRKIDKKVYYTKIFESKSLNIVTYSPPQVGKTNAIIDIVFTSLNKGTPVLLTTDNKCNQLEQLLSRLTQRVENEKIRIDIINMDVLSLSKFEKSVEKCFERRDTNFVITCLDNGSSITKVARLFERLSIKPEFKILNQLTIIHDEADTVTKDENINTSNSEQAVAHRAWIDMIKMLNQKIDVKRFFTTATPENILMKYDVLCKDVVSLEVPSDYRGFKDIECIDLPETVEEDEILNLVKNEVIRVKIAESYEVIVYGIERYNIEQERIMEKMSQIGCIVHTYNHLGIKVVILDETIFNKFYNQLWEDIPMEQWDPMSIKQNYDPSDFVNRNGYTFTIKDVPLRVFYDLCQKSGETCIVTIAQAMIGRSTSLVGETRNTPFAASVLFARPNKTLHQVANAQFLCRVSGCARPELKRKIYAPKDITDYFKQFNINQSLQMKEFYKSENKECLTKDIIDNIQFDKNTSNNIDRSILKLKKLNIIQDDTVEGEIDGVVLSGLKAFLQGDSIPAKILRQLCIDNKSFTQEEMYELVEYTNTMEAFQSTLRNGNSIGSNHHKLWITVVENNHYTIKANHPLKKYIIENNL